MTTVSVFTLANISQALAAECEQKAGYTAGTGWATLVRQQYGYKTLWIIEENNGVLTAIAAICMVRHPIFGNYATTAAYSSYGGAWFAAPGIASEDFFNTVSKIEAEYNLSYTNLRFLSTFTDQQTPTGWTQHPNYCTFKVSLNHTPEDQLKKYGSNHRNHIRKSEKRGFTLRLGGLDLLRDAYEGLAVSMHELGSPYHRQGYLQEMITLMPGQVQVAVIYHSGRIAGAGVFIAQGDTIINLHANVLREFRPDYAGEFFYWSLINAFSEQGFLTFDLGRSLVGSGNEVFKMKWAPERLPLQYWYHLSPGGSLPNLNQKNPKFAIAIETWKRMPEFVVRAVGPYLINGIA